MNDSRRNREGMALLLALFAAVTMAGAIAIVMHSLNNAKRSTDAAVNEVLLEEACKAGIDVAVQQVWGEYLEGNANEADNLASYRAFLDNIIRTNEDLNGNGTRDGNEQDYNGSGTFDRNSRVDLVTVDGAREFDSGASLIGLTLDRTDDVTGCVITIRATAQAGDYTRTAVQTLRVSGERFTGFQFAVLANNINCILCHAQFLNLDLHRNADSAQYGTFDRIRIAALESLLIRKTEADSKVAGTVYTRGLVYNKDGTLLTGSQIAASDFRGFGFDDHGKIIQDDSTGTMAETGLTNATLDAEGKPVQYGNLYLNYPTDSADMTDGELPLKFPSPFPDDNGDRYVNEEEFSKYVNSANGSLTFELPAGAAVGSVKAGVAYGVPAGSSYTGTSLPTSSDADTLSQLAQGSYEGNLILVGTSDDPIVIDKHVAVEGDLVIKGPIKGRGQLLVEGNVYVMGDVTYADAPGKFGEAVDGTENAFAIHAGGSIMMGDYLTIRAKNNYVATKVTSTKYDDRVENATWQGKFVRVDVSTSATSMSSGKTTQVGYFDSGVVDAGAAQGSYSTSTYVSGGKTHTVYTQPEGQFSFTTAELMLFNRMERQKWAPPGHPDYNANYYIPNYTPRYYRLRDTAPIYQYVTADVTNSELKEHAVNYLSPGVEVIAEDDLGTAAVHSLNPDGNWLSENTLRRIWYEDEAYRRAHLDSDGRAPWRFDGLLYTNNSIFGITRGNGRHKSATCGAMIVRGSIVCADLGMLVADQAHEVEYRADGTSDPLYSGLRLYYDRRVDAFLNVEDPTVVEFARLAYRYE